MKWYFLSCMQLKWTKVENIIRGAEVSSGRRNIKLLTSHTWKKINKEAR